MLYWCSVDRTRHSVTNERATSSSEIDHTWYKPELYSDEIQPAQELEGRRSRWVEEAEANEARIFELPITEEVAVELRSPDEAIEMAVSIPELEPLGEQIATLIEMEDSSQGSQEMRNEISSPVGEILAGESEAVSPLSAASEELTNSLFNLFSKFTKREETFLENFL
jgi:hypothetical protein